VLIANSGDNTVTKCTVNTSTGALSNCAHTGSNFNGPSSIFEYYIQSSSSTYAYITNKTDNSVTVCSDNSGVLTNCNRVNSGFSAPVGITAYNSCG
jgi:hypothetical protein